MRMNNKDLDTLIKLSGAFEKSAAEIKVPESLSVENMTAKLKETPQEPPRKNGTVIVFKRFCAVAAAFVFITVLTLFLRNNIGSNTISVKNAFDGFEINNIIKNISSDSELENVISEVFNADDEVLVGASAETETTKASTKDKILSVFNNDKSTTESASSGVIVEDAKSSDTDSLVAQAINYDDTIALIDTVKSVGDYLYILTSTTDTQTSATNEVIRVVKINPAKEMTEVSKITLYDSPSSDVVCCCLGLYVSGDTLVVLMESSEYTFTDTEMTEKSSVLTFYYDISNPESPALKDKEVQEGYFINAKLSNGKFYVVTCKDLSSASATSIPTLSVNGKNVELKTDNNEYIAAENAKEKAVLFITATDITNVNNINKLAIIGCGSKADVEISGNSIYITRLFASASTNQKRTEIYSFSLGTKGMNKIGTYILEGSVVDAPYITDSGYIRLIAAKDGKLSALVLTSGLKKAGELKDFASMSSADITFIGNKACVAGTEKSYVVNFTDPANLKASEITEVKSGSSVYSISDNTAMAVSQADKNGKVTLTLIKNGKVLSTYTLDSNQSAVITSDSRSIVQDKENNIFGVPVIIHDEDSSERSAYILFSTASDTIEPMGVYTHEANYVSDAATRAICSNGVLYTVSNGKISAFSVSEKETLSALTY